VIAANPIDQPETGFGSSRNQAIFLDRHGRAKEIPACSKLSLAHQLISFVKEFEQVQVRDYSLRDHSGA
jgi:phosphopantothenoylcysteine decarboxylase / phosphopantothenate---cysteine ligase